MKRILLLLLLASIFSACQRYQFYSLQSYTANKRSNVADEDSINIYCTSSKDNRLQLEIFNRTAQEKFIDWSKSTLIINDTKLNIYQEQNAINGNNSSTAFSLGLESWSYTEGVFSGQVLNTQTQAFLPPKSRVIFRLPDFGLNFKEYSPDDWSKVKVKVSNRLNESAKLQKFTPESSPWRIRMYLTVKPENAKESIVKDQSFYVSEIVETYQKNYPQILQNNKTEGLDTNKFNKFMVSKSSNVGAVGALLGGIGLAGLVLLVFASVR
jgi:hypothetical protein